MINQSDEIIMAEVQQGDLDKSALLFKRYQAKVYNYFLRICFDEQLSMDLALNTFYRMLHYRSSYNKERSFKSWLFGIARNVFLDQKRSKHSKTDSLESLNYKELSDKNEAIDKFENQALYSVLNRLNNEERELDSKIKADIVGSKLNSRLNGGGKLLKLKIISGDVYLRKR